MVTGAEAAPLNDTGIVGPTTVGARHDGDDARYGRDAAAARGALPKVGASAGSVSGQANGFDFTKVSSKGRTLPDTAVLGSSREDWACTLDNHTGRLWEVKLNDASHFRHMGHTYSLQPGGTRGTGPTGTCHEHGRCDAATYVQAVNAVGLCGFHDWRLPTQVELRSLVDRGRFQPAVDPLYFPNTMSDAYWSNTQRVGRVQGYWATDFESGAGEPYGHAERLHIRLVRQAQ
ncbi:DUF1566 domain-containing protein [Ottowia thiooxydans]|uniref:Lcl C-terminal domain-containing protein n=1 Tax=Ottowia thiooxydans TaxID=219182 RepID=A0ABV2QBR5_9BURK